VASAKSAIRTGAAHYLSKPLELSQLEKVIAEAMEERNRATAGAAVRLPPGQSLPNLVGESPAVQELCSAVLSVAPSHATVLLGGESGTGKELVAAAIHANSPRARGPLVRLHCAALAEGLLESELFGHERGAFTGAATRREGRLAQADGGTLFLDEIGELSASVQVKLLRFLQERSYERVGGNQSLPVDVRVVAATHRDLPALVRDGIFREDLYYRLNVVSIQVPPLRERVSDIPLLAMHFLKRYAARDAREIRGIAPDALARLSGHHWPGNVRELENAIARAVVVCRGELVTVADLPPSVAAAPALPPEGSEPAIPGASLAEIERHAILKTLSWAGTVAPAARVLGVSPRTVHYRLQQYGISRSAVPADPEDEIPPGAERSAS
jgi:DNA-binding NtrC family response regulator